MHLLGPQSFHLFQGYHLLIDLIHFVYGVEGRERVWRQPAVFSRRGPNFFRNWGPAGATSPQDGLYFFENHFL